MIASRRPTAVCLSFALLAACGRPPVPLDLERPPEPASSSHAGHGHGDAQGSLEGLEVRGRVVLTGSLADQTEGRLFLFVEDAHGGGLVLNRAYELSGSDFVAGEGGTRVLEFELGESDRLGSVQSDGHLVLRARLDADGEVLTGDDALADARVPFDAGGGPLEVVLEPLGD